MPTQDSKQRFSSRVADYIRYRPTYPGEIYPHLLSTNFLHPTEILADIGAGTGISAELFLPHGHPLYAVEPNADMRAAAISLLARYANFHPIDGSAEQTTLSDSSIDLAFAAQAFHWFNAPAARAEFIRITRPPHRALLIWNDRNRSATPFARDYESLLNEFGLDYAAVKHDRIPEESIRQFFSVPHTIATFPNHQLFDFTSLRGRLLSSSYAPLPDHPNHAPMLASLQSLFNRHAISDQIRFDYQTILFYGLL